MGCVNSKSDINDTHPNIFHVINVNDRGRPVSRGKLEVTEAELVLHQKGKNPIRWPLRSLRKYGWDVDTDVFSIECGRRSPTGPGYYAFKCRKAEQLFNMVQQHIIGGISETTDNPNLLNALNQNNIEFSVPVASNGPSVQRRPDGSAVYPSGALPSAEATYLNPVQPVTRHTGVLSRPGSVSSNGGQLSPTILSPPLVITEIPPLEHNNNKRNSLALENGFGPPNYANLAPGDLADASCHVYMNVDTKEIVYSNNFVEISKEIVEEMHCYANIDTRDTESLHLLQQQALNGAHPADIGMISTVYNSNSVPCTPTIFTDADYAMVREVNYAELDLDSNRNDKAGTRNLPIQIDASDCGTLTVDSSSIKKKSYATIDFPKTIALSQSINPQADMEEGSRKTRHNSTINSFSD